MALIDEVRTRLRITSTAYDADLVALIAEAKKDMVNTGIISTVTESTSDAMVTGAIKMYCKAHFDLSSPDYEKWIGAYLLQLTKMSLCEGYYVESTD